MFLLQERKLFLQYVVLGYADIYFVQGHSDVSQKYSEADVVKILEYLIDSMFMEFSRRIIQQTIDIPMGTNCVPLPTDLFLYSYEAEFIQDLLRAGKHTHARTHTHKHHLAQKLKVTYRYIDDV